MLNRKITEENSVGISGMGKVGLCRSDIHLYFTKISGGLVQVGFTDKDRYNHFGASRNTIIRDGYVDAVVARILWADSIAALIICFMY